MINLNIFIAIKEFEVLALNTDLERCVEWQDTGFENLNLFIGLWVQVPPSPPLLRLL